MSKEEGKPGGWEWKIAGTLTWDKAVGCVSESKMAGQFTVQKHDAVVEAPVTLNYKMKKEKRKPKPAREPKPHLTSNSPGRRESTPDRTAARKVPQSTRSEKATSLKTAPSVIGLSKFNPND